MFLLQVLIEHAEGHINKATHQAVLTNCQEVSPGVSSQREAYTLLHATESVKNSSVVHIHSEDTNVLLLALRRVPLLGRSPAMMLDTSDRRRLNTLMHIS